VPLANARPLPPFSALRQMGERKRRGLNRRSLRCHVCAEGGEGGGVRLPRFIRGNKEEKKRRGGKTGFGALLPNSSSKEEEGKGGERKGLKLEPRILTSLAGSAENGREGRGGRKENSLESITTRFASDIWGEGGVEGEKGGTERST